MLLTVDALAGRVWGCGNMPWQISVPCEGQVIITTPNGDSRDLPASEIRVIKGETNTTTGQAIEVRVLDVVRDLFTDVTMVLSDGDIRRIRSMVSYLVLLEDGSVEAFPHCRVCNEQLEFHERPESGLYVCPSKHAFRADNEGETRTLISCGNYGEVQRVMALIWPSESVTQRDAERDAPEAHDSAENT